MVAAAVFLGVAGGWRSRKEKTRLPDEFIPSQIALIETHLCFQGCVRNENRLSQLLFLVLCIGYLYGSFFPPFKSDPLVYKGSVQPELYPESCSQHFLIS